MDRRKVEHFEIGDSAEEAKALFQLAGHYGPLGITRLTMIRGDIIVSRDDRFYLDLLIANGLLDRAEVERAICFRERVLEQFDALVTEATGY